MALHFTRDAHWLHDHKTYLTFCSTMTVESDTPFFNLVRWYLTGSITFHRPGRAKCEICASLVKCKELSDFKTYSNMHGISCQFIVRACKCQRQDELLSWIYRINWNKIKSMLELHNYILVSNILDSKQCIHRNEENLCNENSSQWKMIIHCKVQSSRLQFMIRDKMKGFVIFDDLIFEKGYFENEGWTYL